MKKAALAAGAIGLALVASGCSDNVIGSDGPQPGVAAAVEGTEISLDDLDDVTDAFCVFQAAGTDATGNSLPPISRTFAKTEVLRAWIGALINTEYAEMHDLDVAPDDPGLELVPGWDDVDEDDRDALRAYVDVAVVGEAVQQSLGEEQVDPADYDVTINPRFDVKLVDGMFQPAGLQLSVPVSEGSATEDAALTPEELAALPDAELCGKRPDPDAAPPIPVG